MVYDNTRLSEVQSRPGLGQLDLDLTLHVGSADVADLDPDLIGPGPGLVWSRT